MSRRLVTTILAITLFATASAQEKPRSEKLLFLGEIGTYFDNTEYAGNDVGTSRTIFAVRVAPALSYCWNDKHSVVLGADLLKDFGSKRFLDEAELVAYYQFRNERFAANAGIFERDKLMGRYSRAFYSDSTLIRNNLIHGVLLRHTGRKAFVEMAVDWEGLYSPETREKFRVLAATEGVFAKRMYAGAAFMLQHYANRSTFHGNVVDNILLNPYVGVRFTAFFDFDIRLGYLQGLQRDRMLDAGWDAPMGGELYFRFSRWGVFIDNNLYVGKGLMPFYHNLGKDGLAYGCDLYTGDPLYATSHKIYNRTGVGYERKFWKERIAVRAEVALQYTGTKLCCQQLIGLSAKIAPTLYDKAKHNKK